jgi:hypothetical protein
VKNRNRSSAASRNVIVKDEPAEGPASNKDDHRRGRFFPKKPPDDPLDFLTERVISLVPGRIGKVIAVAVWSIAIAVWLIGASLTVYGWYQWTRH